MSDCESRVTAGQLDLKRDEAELITEAWFTMVAGPGGSYLLTVAMFSRSGRTYFGNWAASSSSATGTRTGLKIAREQALKKALLDETKDARRANIRLVETV